MEYGGKLTDYVQIEKEIAKEYDLLVVDSYYELGINKENIKQFSDDGVHLNYDGRQKMAEFLASKLYGEFH